MMRLLLDGNPMETVMLDEEDRLRGVGEAFLRALANRDFEALRACLQDDVAFRALVPPGVRQATDAPGAVNRLRLWFGDADSFEVLRTEIGRVVDRLSIAYRIRLHDPDGWQVIEQRLYCDVGDDGRIRNLDLLCSGFLPEGPPPRSWPAGSASHRGPGSLPPA